MWCPLSLPTVSSVSACPSNNIEWVSAAKRKSCNDLAKIQNCTNADNFVYHCVLNEKATMLLEVCAPAYYLTGYCARFSEVYKSIINDPGLDCTKFDPPCPSRFQSNESFRYQLCYQNTTGFSIPDEPLHPKQHDVSYLLSSGLLVMFAFIDVTLFLLLAVGIKFKLIQFTRSHTKDIFCKDREDFTLQNELQKVDKRLETEKEHFDHDAIGKPCPNVEITDGWEDYISDGRLDCSTSGLEDSINNDEEMDVDQNEMFQYRTLSNSTDEWCSRKGIETISDVRDALAEKLHIARKHIFVVNKKEGKILKDNTVVAKLINRPFEVMIANQNRTLIPGCHTRMSCGHFTPQDALFEWTKSSLLSGINAGRSCPECTKSWGMSELMEKGNMSLDEKIFFEQVFMINRRTPSQLDKYRWLNRGVKTGQHLRFTQESSVDPMQNIDKSPADH